MKTSDERREVAERLRELPSHADADGCCTVWDVLFALGMKASDTIGFVPADNAMRLADLIDPTCEDMVTHHEDASAPGKKACDGYFRCNRCNFNVRVFESIGFGLMAMIEVRYCPNCGARVVRPNGD